MNNDSNNARYAFPVITAVVLFLTFAVLLLVLLNEANLVTETQASYPQPTPYTAPEVAAAPEETPVAAEATPEAPEVSEADVTATADEPADETTASDVEATPLVDVTVAPEVADANADVDVAPVDDAATGVVLDPAMIAQGQTAFATVCTACHGMGATGVQGLGPNLITSEFVNSLTDEDLAHFIVVGRDFSDPANTTGIAMPARGGNPALTDAQIDLIVVYLRSLAAEAGIQPIHTGMNTSDAAAPVEEVDAAPAPTRDPNFVAAPWTAPVPVSDRFVAVEDLPEDTQRLYRWASEGNVADLSMSPDVFDVTLLERGNEAALMDFLVNDTGYIDRDGGLPSPMFGGELSLPAPEGE